MPDYKFQNLRLIVMQDILPIGIALLDRVRKGGTKKVVEVFTSLQDPIQDLKVEGEFGAASIREQLDEINPGLGNPVMEVEVSLENSETHEEFTEELNLDDESSLMSILNRIEERLDILQTYLEDNNNVLE